MLLGTFPQSTGPHLISCVMAQTTTGAKAPKEPPDASPAQASMYARPRTTGRNHVDQLLKRSHGQCLHASASMQRGTRLTRRPPASTGTASPHPCWCPGSRRASTPHPRTPHAGTARTHMSRHAPSTPPETSLFAYGSRVRGTPATRSRPVHMAWDREAQPSTPW